MRTGSQERTQGNMSANKREDQKTQKDSRTPDTPPFWYPIPHLIQVISAHLMCWTRATDSSNPVLPVLSADMLVPELI